MLRLGMYKDQIVVRRAETEKGERYALAALRFFTGVQSRFDVPDEPLKAPDVPIAPLNRYLTAARLFRPDVNMARAGLVARKAWVDYQRARYYPDIGLGVSAFYSYAPSAERQTNAWTGDPFNNFGFGFFAGARWPLDFLAQSARVQQAEAQLQETRALERMALGGVGVEVENQYGIVVEAKARVDRWGHMTRTARKWIATVQDSIELGTRDQRALLEPVRYYVDARSQELYATHDLNVQLSELSRLTGWDTAAPTGR
ncbi:MAG: TolC family protein [Proteobacteria bacterium]|nr:MAG: TolC family protein [Pseudomonadota bacterium]